MRLNVVAAVFLAALFSCKTPYQPVSVQYSDYRITERLPASDPVKSMLKPYSDSVNRSMNDVIAVADMPLEKKQPEGTLGNVLADAILWKAKLLFGTADIAFVNYGGVRLPAIAAGPITRGKVFEIAPFDNQLVLLEVSGTVLQQFLNHIAGRGGWPCAGVQFVIEAKKATSVLINGEPLHETSVYRIALPDYVASGGDDCQMLKPIPQQNKGYLLRDAVMEYLAGFQQKGQSIHSTIQNRIRNAQ